MKQIIKQLFSMIYNFVRRVRGEKVVELKLFGIQLLLISKSNTYNWNVFILYIPMLRICNAPTRFGINLLIFTWIYAMFTKWEIVENKDVKELRFCGRSIYSKKEVVPYRFPTAMFRG